MSQPFEAPTTRIELANYLNQPELADRILGKTAQYLQAELDGYGIVNELHGPNAPAEPISDSLFASWFDKGAPTIAIDANNCFVGSPLIGVAAARPELTTANIVYVASPAHGLSIEADNTRGQNTLVARSGMFILADGRVIYGHFPEPLKVSLLSTADETLVESCASAGILTTSSPESMAQTRNKHRLAEMLQGDSISHAPRLPKSYLDTPERTDEVAIKPGNASLGRGVLLSDSTMPQAHLRLAYDLLEDTGYEPIIEKRIESWPIYDELSGKRLDWNVRALISDGALVDMYVRADDFGKPVNRITDARAISMTDFAQFFPDPADAVAVQRKLRQAGHAVAASLPNGYFGADITVDKNLQAVLFEINGENSGGLQTIAELATSYSEKLRNADTILTGWLERLESPVSIEPTGSSSRPQLAVSLGCLVFGIELARQLFRKLPPRTN